MSRVTRYVTYVIELSDTVEKRRRIPPRRSSKPYVYVGYTSKSRAARLAEHRAGRYAGDRRWAPHYVRARPDLYMSSPPVATLVDALDAERDLADALVARGYTVVNKTGERLSVSARPRP